MTQSLCTWHRWLAHIHPSATCQSPDDTVMNHALCDCQLQATSWAIYGNCLASMNSQIVSVTWQTIEIVYSSTLQQRYAETVMKFMSDMRMIARGFVWRGLRRLLLHCVGSFSSWLASVGRWMQSEQCQLSTSNVSHHDSQSEALKLRSCNTKTQATEMDET